jgi:hypothetical protein
MPQGMYYRRGHWVRRGSHRPSRVAAGALPALSPPLRPLREARSPLSALSLDRSG